MELTHIVALAILQGITEFLPISSSAHLILVPMLTSWQDQGLAFDIAVHVGTLAAVVLYFRTDLRCLFRDWTGSLREKRSVGESHLAWAVIIGTVPVGIAGLLLGETVETTLRSPWVIAWATIGFGLLLWWADARGAHARDEHRLRWRDALLIGCAQALALIPGTSRSGITMTAALMLGMTRTAAARFSFLLSIPVILLAGASKPIELIQSGNQIEWSALIIGAAVSAISAYLCIHLLLKLLERIGMFPFVAYRLLLGGWLLLLYA